MLIDRKIALFDTFKRLGISLDTMYLRFNCVNQHGWDFVLRSFQFVYCEGLDIPHVKEIWVKTKAFLHPRTSFYPVKHLQKKTPKNAAGAQTAISDRNSGLASQRRGGGLVMIMAVED